MKVVHLCNNLWWGSGKAARRLHEGLLAIGVDSSILVHDVRTDAAQGVHALQTHGGLLRRVERAASSRLVRYSQRRYAATRPAGADLFVDERALPVYSEDPRVADADIVNLHWVGQGGESTRFFAGLAGKRVVWTLHDMLSFTGGCVYSGACTRYRERCGSCPQLGSQRDGDASRAIWRRKHSAYEEHQRSTGPLHVVAPSHWLARCATASSLLRECPVQVISNGLPTDVFQPRDQAHSRQLLGIPDDHFVLLAGSLDARTARKGFAPLAHALQLLSERGARRPLSLVTFGTQWSHATVPAEVNVVAIGRVEDERLMSCVYSAADVTLVPSLEDNQPLVMLESLACGTPVIGFETGGIPDVVAHEINGLLAARGDSRALAAAIERVWSAPEWVRQLGHTARERALEHLTIERQAQTYRALYESLLQGAQR